MCHSLAPTISLDNVRHLVAFYDPQKLGQINIMQFLRACLEILNQQIGGGIFALKQVHPIVCKIVDELSIDIERFFDKVAEANQEHLEEQEALAQARNPSRKPQGPLSDEQIINQGLDKSIFFK